MHYAYSVHDCSGCLSLEDYAQGVRLPGDISLKS